MSGRQIVPYIRRDDIAWWAGCRYPDRAWNEAPYIRETSCFTRWGARWKAKRLAVKARRLRDRGLAGYQMNVGDPA